MQLFNILVLPAIFSILPCTIFKPELLYYPEPWIFYFAGAMMIVSQPKTSFVPGSKTIKSEFDSSNNTLLFSVSYILMGLAIFLFIKDPFFHEFNQYRILSISIGSLFITIGLILRVKAIKTLGKHFTANLVLQENHQLITHGVFNKMRHPSYTGAVLIMISPPILYQQKYLFAVTFILIILVYIHRIKLEEKMLLSKFPEDYKDYKTRSYALLPFIW